MITIELKFDKTVSGLAGYPFAKSEYQKQVKEKYTNYSERLVIVFPDNIEKVASSFVQGFFEDLVNEIGYEGIEKNVTIKAKNDKLAQLIFERLF